MNTRRDSRDFDQYSQDQRDRLDPESRRMP